MPPPKPNPVELHGSRCQHLASLRGGIAHRRRDRAIARFIAWRAALPAVAAAVACEPYFDVPFRGSQGQTLHKCIQCGNDRILGRFRATPCTSSGNIGVVSLSPAQFQKLAGSSSKSAEASKKKLAISRRLLLRGTSEGIKYRQAVMARYHSYLRARRQYTQQCKRNGVAPLRCREWRIGHTNRTFEGPA